MWKLYSESYLKHNRASCRSVMGAVLVAVTFLSLICTLGYNLWTYEIVRNGTFDATPLAVFFLGLLITAVLALALIIRSTFELSMNVRIHQLGILSSIGATPKQIRMCLLQETAVLCAVPTVVGCLLGIAICFGVMEAVNFFAAGAAGRQDAVFQYHAGVLGITLLCAGVTVLSSAGTGARKLSKLSPIEAIRNSDGLKLRKKKRSRLLSGLFGVEGEIAGNALKAQKKALRIANLSLILSFLGFTVMLCFTVLSSISTRHTYFERYRDCWDVMVTVQDTKIGDFAHTEGLQALSGVGEAAVYQKAEGTYALNAEDQSRELLALGGYEILGGQTDENGMFQVKAQIVILDDSSFLAYCRQTGNRESLDGAILLNRIWDNVNSNFRYKVYIPFVEENFHTGMGIPVLGYTQQAPSLREEYPNYALVHFVPQSLWESLAQNPGTEEADMYIRIFSSTAASLENLNALQAHVGAFLSPAYQIELENRIQEQISNDGMIAGMQWIFGFFCALLAMIGIANVFSNTLGFLHSRRREFAQYMSIGLTPEQMRKLFGIEAFVIAGKPLMVTLPITLLFVEFAARASYLDPKEFWAEAPVLPILLFAGAIVGFVALAYGIGGRSLMQCDLRETLRNDTVM